MQNRRSASPLQSAGSPALDSAADALPPELRAFIDRLKSAQAGAAPAARGEDDAQRLLYVLGAEDRAPQRVELRLVSARVGKGGGYAGGQRFTNVSHALSSPPAYFSGEDLRILRGLLLDGDFASDGTYKFGGRTRADVLADIIATGRCHWDSADSPVLRAGGKRAARIEWRSRANGDQLVHFATDPPITAIVASSPLWFVDVANALAGELASPLDSPTTLVLSTAPAVPPLLAAAARKALREQSGDLPLPVELPEEETGRVAPVPRLTLYSDPHAAKWMGRALGGLDTLHYAKLDFDYLGLPAEGDGPGELVGYSAGRIRRVQRDFRSERMAAARLQQEQFGPLREIASNVIWPRNLAEAYTFTSEDQWLRFMMRIPILREEGWKIELDPSFTFEVEQPDRWLGTVAARGDQWFDVELGIDIAGERVSLVPLLPAIERAIATGPKRDAVLVRRPNGKLLALPRERVERILALFAELAEPLNASALRLHRLDSARLTELPGVELKWMGPATARRIAEKLAHFGGIEPVQPPAGFNARLRGYQLTGLAWLQFIREVGTGGVLADDMGLGKTVQTLAHLTLEKEAGRLENPALVVVPTSVIHNWMSERERFAPGLRLLLLHGPQRKRDFSQISSYDIVLTTYPLLSRDRKHLAEHEFSAIVLDESQHVKNASTQAARALSELRSQHRLCLTGTPLENHLGELWALFRFLMPGFLGDEPRFRKLYRVPIEKNADSERRRQLVQRIRPFILRRTKEMVAAELPPKTEIIQRIEMSGAQRDLYETVRAAVDRTVRSRLEQHGLGGSQIILLDALLKLRQTCCDPRLVRLSGARGINESAKLEALMERLPALIEEGRRVLVFSQFAEMIKLLSAALTAAGIQFVTLTGETTDRRTPIARFQSLDVPVFLISLKAGGVGLNLTAADTVIHYDPWWNPAVERQATDRAHRIGQDKPVFVYKLIIAGSVEERILELQERKAALASAILEGGDLGAAQLTREDVEALLRPLED
jgi:superfamily II DNA or RNA helicase